MAELNNILQAILLERAQGIYYLKYHELNKGDYIKFVDTNAIYYYDAADKKLEVRKLKNLDDALFKCLGPITYYYYNSDNRKIKKDFLIIKYITGDKPSGLSYDINKEYYVSPLLDLNENVKYIKLDIK